MERKDRTKYNVLFGKQLKKLRTERSLSPNQLAGLIDCSPAEIGRYEQGTSSPSGWRIRALANALEVSTEELLPGSL